MLIDTKMRLTADLELYIAYLRRCVRNGVSHKRSLKSATHDQDCKLTSAAVVIMSTCG